MLDQAVTGQPGPPSCRSLIKNLNFIGRHKLRKLCLRTGEQLRTLLWLVWFDWSSGTVGRPACALWKLLERLPTSAEQPSVGRLPQSRVLTNAIRRDRGKCTAGAHFKALKIWEIKNVQCTFKVHWTHVMCGTKSSTPELNFKSLALPAS